MLLNPILNLYVWIVIFFQVVHIELMSFVYLTLIIATLLLRMCNRGSGEILHVVSQMYFFILKMIEQMDPV